MTNSDMARRGSPADLKIMIRTVVGLVVGGVLLYGLHSYIFHPAPAVLQVSTPAK